MSPSPRPHGSGNASPEQSSPEQSSPDQLQQERRRINRADGQRLLFGAAQDFARQQGSLTEGDRASFACSVLGRHSYTLRDENDELITRVALSDARVMLRFRRELARQIMVDAKVQPRSEQGQPLERRTVKLQKAEVRALCWAIGTGRRFPFPPDENRQGVITLALLLCCLIPGLVYYVRVVLRNREEYQTNLNELVSRWRLVGQPDPPASFFAHYDLT